MQVKTNFHLRMGCSLGSWCVVEGMVAVPLIISAGSALRQPAMWIPTILLFAVALLLAVWLGAFRIEVADGMLTYRSLFGGAIRIGLENIAKAEFQVGCRKYADLFRPTVRLLIQSKDGRRFDINLKVFKRDQIGDLLAALGA